MIAALVLAVVLPACVNPGTPPMDANPLDRSGPIITVPWCPDPPTTAPLTEPHDNGLGQPTPSNARQRVPGSPTSTSATPRVVVLVGVGLDRPFLLRVGRPQ